MLDYFIWTILTICAVAFLVNPLCNIAEDLFNRDGGYSRKHAAFMDGAAAAGMSYHEATDQLFLREAMARLRREATDAVRAEPAIWSEKLDKAKQDAFNFVAEHDKALLPVFGQMLAGLSYGHILYPEEARMVDRLMTGFKWARPSEDQVAALNIVRPG